MAKELQKKYPLTKKYLSKMCVLFESRRAPLTRYRRDVFTEYDKDKDDKLSLNDLATMLQTIGSKVTSYPAVSLLPRYRLAGDADSRTDRPGGKPAGQVPGSQVWQASKAARHVDAE